MKGPPAAVLDTNVALSALVFAAGRASAVRNAWHAQRFEPLVSRWTTDELVRALAYPKFKLTPLDQRELLADYLPYCRTVVIPARRPAVPDCRDPFDRPFLELAVAGKAQFLVTGDKDLFSLPKFPCPIVTIDAFLAALPGT
jgi:putative PIN family toxin of toxin-antitoxin system